MAQVKIKIPGLGEQDGETPIVILGPNGSGKTQLAQKIAGTNPSSAISAQRKTWVSSSLPVEEERQLRRNAQQHIDRWKSEAWLPTEELSYLLSSLVQSHTTTLMERNEQAIKAGTDLKPVRDSRLVLLQSLWSRLFPKRRLEIVTFFPRVRRLDGSEEGKAYDVRQMSDGERTVLYMAARVLTADQPLIIVDEPELHMHCRLAVSFWDEAERLRPDCRFVYITHDLHFALSRRSATILVAKAPDVAEAVPMAEVPSFVAAEVLGAATLPFYAKRVVFFEGEVGKGFADRFLSVWFRDDATFLVPGGNRASVLAATTGLRSVGISGGEVLGLVDRDYYSDDLLRRVPDGVHVLPVHEVESVLCDPKAISALATHLGKDAPPVADSFLSRVRKEFHGRTLSAIVARRVRARVGDLLEQAFDGSQIADNLKDTESHHTERLANLDLPAKASRIFDEESKRVSDALSSGGEAMLAMLPGKHLLSLLAAELGLASDEELEGLVVRALSATPTDEDGALRNLGMQLAEAFRAYLPPRQAEAASEAIAATPP